MTQSDTSPEVHNLDAKCWLNGCEREYTRILELVNHDRRFGVCADHAEQKLRTGYPEMEVYDAE
jgi:hypothetical protein